MKKRFHNPFHLRHRGQNPNPNYTTPPAMLPDSASDSGELRQEEETASSSSSAVVNSDEQEEDEIGYVSADDVDSREAEEESAASTKKSVGVVEKRENEFMLKMMEKPPSDDCCPICFANFVLPCRAPCGHWYCGGCILQYWNYGAALQPCNCPMCSRKITNLTPEASLYSQQDAEVVEVLKRVQKYNRLFVGGTYGLMLKLLGLPFYMKRVFNEMMNPDRPGAHLNKLRIFAAVKMSLMCLITPQLHSPRCYIWLDSTFDVDASSMSGIWLRQTLLLIDSRQQMKQIPMVDL